MQIGYSNIGVRSNVGKTAGVSTGELDVTIFTPGGTPRVLDSPDTVGDTDEEDTVVEGSSAVGEDTSLVERPVGGINGNSDGLFSKGNLQVRDATGGDVSE